MRMSNRGIEDVDSRARIEAEEYVQDAYHGDNSYGLG